MIMNYLKNYIGRTTLCMLTAPLFAQSACAITSEEIFPSKLDGMVIKGVYVRKGTIAATFTNLLALDKLLSSNGSAKEIADIIKDQRELGRGLYALDLFQMQPLENWLRDASRQGKILVAALTLQDCPEMMTASIEARLEELVKTSHPVVQAEIKKVLG